MFIVSRLLFLSKLEVILLIFLIYGNDSLQDGQHIFGIFLNPDAGQGAIAILLGYFIYTSVLSASLSTPI
jgi:hypothetical protein